MIALALVVSARIALLVSARPSNTCFDTASTCRALQATSVMQVAKAHKQRAATNGHATNAEKVERILVAQELSTGAITRTPWRAHDGLETGGPAGYADVISISPPVTRHGDERLYTFSAGIPEENATGWYAPPDAEIINSLRPSRFCPDKANVECLAGADFTYYETTVNIPPATTITRFTIDFTGMDDGSVVTIINSQHPTGKVVPGSYVFIGQPGTANLVDLVVEGRNRVIITQVDDCCAHNNIEQARVVIDGNTITFGPTPSGPSPSTPLPPAPPTFCQKDTQAPCFNDLCFQRTRGNTTCIDGTCHCALPSDCVYLVTGIPLTKEWRVCRDPRDPDVQENTNMADGTLEGTALASPVEWLGMIVADVVGAYATVARNSLR